MIEVKETIIYLKPVDAELFLAFQKNYANFKLLYEADVFKQKNATVAINFNSLGEIGSIQRQDFLFSKLHK